MSIQIFLVLVGLMLVGLMLAGVLLMAFGWRGRRIGRAPTCRQCQFDLTDVLPSGATCPECGSGLKRDGAVRVGRRKRVVSAVLLGLVMVVAPGSMVALVGAAMITGTDLNIYKPMALLEWDAMNGTAAQTRAVGVELRRRQNAGELGPADLDRAVELALRVQADQRRVWSEDWGDLIETADIAGAASEEQYQRFLNQMLVLEFETRPVVAPGKPLPVVVRVSETRCGSGTQTSVVMQLSGARVDGEDVLGEPVTPSNVMEAMLMPTQGPRQFGSFWVAGSASRMGFSQNPESSTVIEMPEDLADGAHELELDVQMVAAKAQGGMWVNPSAIGQGKGATFRPRIAFKSGDAGAIEVIEPSGELDDAVRMALFGNFLQAYVHEMHPGVYSGQMSFNLEGLDTPIAYDVIWKTPEREWNLGTICSGSGYSGSNINYGQAHMRGVWKEMRRLEQGTRIDLILRPNPDAALSTVDQTRAYGGEIVYEDIQVQWMLDDGSSTSGGSNAIGRVLRALFGG